MSTEPVKDYAGRRATANQCALTPSSDGSLSIWRSVFIFKRKVARIANLSFAVQSVLRKTLLRFFDMSWHGLNQVDVATLRLQPHGIRTRSALQTNRPRGFADNVPGNRMSYVESSFIAGPSPV